LQHPLALLIAHFGEQRGLYLFGEWSALQTLGPETYLKRHSPLKVAALEAQLAPLNLWPFPSVFEGHRASDTNALSFDGSRDRASNQLSLTNQQLDPLLSLRRTHFTWAAGVDLFDQEARWADEGNTIPGGWFIQSQIRLSSHWGFLFPALNVRLEPTLGTHEYRIEIWDEVVAEGEAFPGLDCILSPNAPPLPPAPYPWSPDPASEGWLLWMPIGPGAAPPSDLERVHWLTQVTRHVNFIANQHRHRLLPEDMVTTLLTEARRAGYTHELERYVSVAEIWRVFRQLLSQGIPLRPMPLILDALLTAILEDLARRRLSVSEYERLGRRLPLFSTERLVAEVRRALGLPKRAT
jgi:hypothetical protein